MSVPSIPGGDVAPQQARELAAHRARHAVLAIAKAHTLFSGAANSLSPEHREYAEEGFALLEGAVRDLRDVVARLECDLQPAERRGGEGED